MLANNPFTLIYVMFLGEIKKKKGQELYMKTQEDSITYLRIL